MAEARYSLREARRLALAAQGFDRPQPAGKVGLRLVRATIRRLGLLQIDPISVVAPAHHMVLFSRLGPYKTALLDELVYRRREFTEQWAHEASILPVEVWPLLRHRMAAFRIRPYGFEKFLEANPWYQDWVLEQVRERGALSGSDLPERDGIERQIRGDAWVGSVPRATLEALFSRGVLAIANRRSNMARVYDLAERVVGGEHLRHVPDKESAQRQLILQAAQAHGIGTAADLADYYRMPPREAQARILELVGSGQLVEARVDGWREAAYMVPDTVPPRRIEANALLSPFDPVVWFRKRTERLFGFEYRLEIYVPEHKRRWGYYVLPFLFGESLVARVDVRADRRAGCLYVLAAYAEPGTDHGNVAPALAGQLRILAAWQGLDSLEVGWRGNLARALRSTI